MLIDKKIDILRQKYNISNKELEDLGLIRNNTKIMSSRVTKDEHVKITKICYEKGWYTSEIIRKYIIDSIKKKKVNVKAIKELKNKKISKKDEAHITLQVENRYAIQFEDLCNQNYVSVSSAIRSIVIQICRKEGKKNK